MAEQPTVDTGNLDVTRLRRGFDGQVLLPDDDGYHQARRVWNAIVDRRPAVIARCASPSDVAAAVRFAAERDLEIAVRCGGHSVLGLSVPEGGLMVDLSLLRSVRVDPARRRAWVAGGAVLGDLDRASQPYEARDYIRQRLRYRRGRAHAGRRDGLARAAIRPGLRQRDPPPGGDRRRRDR